MKKFRTAASGLYRRRSIKRGAHRSDPARVWAEERDISIIFFVVKASVEKDIQKSWFCRDEDIGKQADRYSRSKSGFQ